MKKYIFILIILCSVLPQLGAQPNPIVYKHMDSGMLNFKLGKMNAAIDDFGKAIELRPTYADAYYSRGVSYLKLRDYSAARNDFEQTINWNPMDAQAFYYKGECNRSLRNYAEANTDFTSALAYGKDTDPSTIKYKRAEARMAIKDYTGAEADYKDALAKYPNGYVIFYRLSLMLYAQNRYDESLTYLNTILEKNARHINARMLRANIYLYRDEYAKAIADYSAVIAQDPNYATPYFQRAMAFRGSKKIMQACRDLEIAQELGYPSAESMRRQICK